MSCYANGFLRPVTDVPQRRHFTTAKKGKKGIAMNYIRLLAGLRGGFQKGVAAGHILYRGYSLRRLFHFDQSF